MIRFFVAGIPAPGGSKKGFVVAGRVNIVDASKGNKDWKARVATEAQRVHGNAPLLEGPLVVEFTFSQTRPKSHYRTGKFAGELREGAPPYPTNKPDCLKLCRSTEDAITGIIWKDDAQTVCLVARKRYWHRPGCHVQIARPGEGEIVR